MARVTYGESVTKYKGSVGGVTFQGNPSGDIIKLKTSFPVNPSTGQSENHRIFAACVAAWQALAPVHRDTWVAYAAANKHYTAWGEEKTLSAYQWFMACGLDCYTFEEEFVNTAPTDPPPAPCDQFTLFADEDELSLNWDPAYQFEWAYNLLYCSPPLKQGNINLRRNLFILPFKPSGLVTKIDITTYFENYFNVTWSTLFNNSQCFIVVRIRICEEVAFLTSAYTSDIIKIG